MSVAGQVQLFFDKFPDDGSSRIRWKFWSAKFLRGKVLIETFLGGYFNEEK